MGVASLGGGAVVPGAGTSGAGPPSSRLMGPMYIRRRAAAAREAAGGAARDSGGRGVESQQKLDELNANGWTCTVREEAKGKSSKKGKLSGKDGVGVARRYKCIAPSVYNAQRGVHVPGIEYRSVNKAHAWYVAQRDGNAGGGLGSGHVISFGCRGSTVNVAIIDYHQW